jgi:hypothetical protein
VVEVLPGLIMLKRNNLNSPNVSERQNEVILSQVRANITLSPLVTS